MSHETMNTFFSISMSRYCMGHIYNKKNYSLLTWNSNLTGHPILHLATLSVSPLQSCQVFLGGPSLSDMST